MLADRRISVYLASSILNVAALAVDDEAFDDTIAYSMIDGVMRNDVLTIYTPLLIESPAFLTLEATYGRFVCACPSYSLSNEAITYIYCVVAKAIPLYRCRR